MPEAPARVAILLSTYNGARFLPDQLASLLAQTHHRWVLHWRDDGSTDETVAILRDFAARTGRCVEHAEPSGNLRPAASFLALLRAVAPTLGDAGRLAFCDQDDVWLPDKLARGVAALADAEGPALYCARQVLVDAALRRIGESARLTGPTAFPAALTQNVATGCTMLLTPAAARLVAASRPPAGTVHDWWCYLAVTAAGGRLIRDETPVMLYRQHAANAIGSPTTRLRRALAAAGRGRGAFMGVLRQHVAAMLETPELWTKPARDALRALDGALASGMRARLGALTMPGLRRQTAVETALFRVWLLGG